MFILVIQCLIMLLLLLIMQVFTWVIVSRIIKSVHCLVVVLFLPLIVLSPGSCPMFCFAIVYLYWFISLVDYSFTELFNSVNFLAVLSFVHCSYCRHKCREYNW